MKNSIFSKNELAFLKTKGEIDTCSNNLYQIKYSIKKKLSNFIENDLKLLLEIKEEEIKNSTNKRIKNLINDNLITNLIINIMEFYPQLILKINRLQKIKDFLHFIDEEANESEKLSIFETYQLKGLVTSKYPKNDV